MLRKIMTNSSLGQVHVILRDGAAPSECKLYLIDHRLSDCPNYLKAPWKSTSTAENGRACFICPNESHFATTRRRKSHCSEKGCWAGTTNCFTRLLVPAHNIAKTSAVCSISQTTQKPVRLGVVAVVVVTPTGLVKALASVDSDSDTTLTSEQFVPLIQKVKS